MNRPFWLDLIYLGAFFVPASVGAAITAIWVSEANGLPLWGLVLLTLGCEVVSMAVWLACAVAWSRLVASTKKVRGSNDGNRE